MNYNVQSVFSEFLENLGVNPLPTPTPEMIHLEFERSGVLTIEYINESELLVSLAKHYLKTDVELYESSLILSKLESRSSTPIRVGLVSGNCLALTSRITSEEVDVSVLFSTFRKLSSHHERLIGSQNI